MNYTPINTLEAISPESSHQGCFFFVKVKANKGIIYEWSSDQAPKSCALLEVAIMFTSVRWFISIVYPKYTCNSYEDGNFIGYMISSLQISLLQVWSTLKVKNFYLIVDGAHSVHTQPRPQAFPLLFIS